MSADRLRIDARGALGMVVTNELAVLIEATQKRLTRVWIGAIALSVVVGSWSSLPLLSGSKGSPFDSTTWAAILAVAILAHVLPWWALSRSRLSGLAAREVDLDSYPDDSGNKTILSSPIEISLRFSGRVSRSEARSLSEDDRPLLNILEAAAFWNTMRIYLLLLFGGAITVVAAGHWIVAVAWTLLMLSSFPRILPWVLRAAE